MNNKVMIVDDEPDVLCSLKLVLEKNNYDVITATDGGECLKHLEKGFKGIILMDLMMPNMDGWETIVEIVKRGYMKNVAISIITGKGTKDFQKMSNLASYIFDYLAKPLNVEQLITSVERCNRYYYKKSA
ncbi:MAG TPA: response regulator [Bacteroidetes bacterium]|nr:response regulator [Bacteroidota bacterium]